MQPSFPNGKSTIIWIYIKKMVRGTIFSRAIKQKGELWSRTIFSRAIKQKGELWSRTIFSRAIKQKRRVMVWGYKQFGEFKGSGGPFEAGDKSGR